jgi:peptide/nickel transport system substrate-binding protein
MAARPALVMTANKAWWDKLQGNVTDVVYTPIKSDPTRIAALLAGNVDAVTDLPTQDVARLRNTPALSVLDGPEVRTIFLSLDLGSDELKYGQKGPNVFKDVRVRKALSMSIDRAAIQRSIMRGLSLPASIIVAPGVNGYTLTWTESLRSTSKVPKTCWLKLVTPMALSSPWTALTTAM